jgi:hypothetical protein
MPLGGVERPRRVLGPVDHSRQGVELRLIRVGPTPAGIRVVQADTAAAAL